MDFSYLILIFLINCNNVVPEINLHPFEQVKNSLNFTGKVALVTGSGSGMGAETVRLLSYLGAQVVVSEKNETKVKQVALQCAHLSPNKLQVNFLIKI